MSKRARTSNSDSDNKPDDINKKRRIKEFFSITDGITPANSQLLLSPHEMIGDLLSLDLKELEHKEKLFKTKLSQLTKAAEKKRKLEDICPNCHEKKGKNIIYKREPDTLLRRRRGKIEIFCHFPHCDQKKCVEEYCENCKALHLFKCTMCNKYYCDTSHRFQFTTFDHHDDPICGWCYFKSIGEDKNFSRLLHVLGLEMETNISRQELFRKLEMICYQHWDPAQSKKKWRIVCLDDDNDDEEK